MILRWLPAAAAVRLLAEPDIKPKPLPEPAHNVDAGTLLVGTLWCGKGHLLWHHNVVEGREIQGTNAKHFGELSTAAPYLDSCCRLHDYCPWFAKEGDPQGYCSSAQHVTKWTALRDQTLKFDLEDAAWGAVSKPFLGEKALPGFVPYEQCGPIEEPGGRSMKFASGCACDRAFLSCLNGVDRRQPRERPAVEFIREVYFHTALTVRIPLGPLSKLLTTNVDRHCIEREPGKFVRDMHTDRFHCVCSGGCGAGSGEDRAWCYTKDKCGAPSTLGHWDFCDKFCFDSAYLCRGYDAKWVQLAA